MLRRFVHPSSVNIQNLINNNNYLKTEKYLIKLWEEEKIQSKILEKNKNGKVFTLHSGPPYANGKIHIGHVLNFVIKDIIIRSRFLKGFYTSFLLGWDTHGLPIEHKFLQGNKNKPDNLREQCHSFALKQVQIQKEQLKRLGLFTDYEKYYLTLSKKYESEQIKVFGKIVKKDLIYRGLRPIYWSCSHETALAENEIEYYEKEDTSLYFKIKLSKKFWGEENVSLVVWTTQPWTIPANQLVAIKKKSFYALVIYKEEFLIIIKEKIFLLEKDKIKIKKILSGEELLGLSYFHPYQEKKGYIVDGDDFIKAEEGTGIVHLAPALGAEDFAVARREKLTVENCIESNGVFNHKIGVLDLIGMHYLEANDYIVSDLEKRGFLIKREIIKHSFPHDWRDKTPLICRLTNQWFIKIESIKKDILKNIEKVKWYPAWTKEKMKSAIFDRDDWCISRQRKWGVPVPVLYKEEKEPILNVKIIDYIAGVFAERGSDCWFDGSILPLLKEKFPNLVDKKTILETDVMDVWFDSGISHWCVLRNNL